MVDYINNLIKKFNYDVNYYEKNIPDKSMFLINLKNLIKDTTKTIYETNDIILKNENTKKLSRYYDLLYYINGKEDKGTMYVLDNEISSLPPVYIVDQKPELFEIDYNLLSDIDISQGLTEEQAKELLRWTVNNTRENLNISNSDNKEDVYENCFLGGTCGFSQFSSLYPLQKLGLTITINNMSSLNNYGHAFGTVIIPINRNGNIINKRYLIDCTYNQFFGIQNNVVSRYINDKLDAGFFVAQDEEKIEFAKELLKNGFVEASLSNLEKYLKPFYAMSLSKEEIGQIDTKFSKIDIIDLLENHQREFDYTEEEFVDWGMNLDTKFNSKKL